MVRAIWFFDNTSESRPEERIVEAIFPYAFGAWVALNVVGVWVWAVLVDEAGIRFNHQAAKTDYRERWHHLRWYGDL